MKKKVFLAAMLLMVLAVSCKKEVITSQIETATSSPAKVEDSNYVPLNGDSTSIKMTHSMTPTEVIDSYVPLNLGDSILDYTAEKGIVKPININGLVVKPIGRLPRVLAELKSDPQFSALWDFDRWETQSSDTVGFQVYFIPPVRNEETEILNDWNILTIGVENNIVTRKYVLSFPDAMGLNFDEYIQDCKSHYRDIHIEFLSYDYSEIFLGGYYSTSLRDFVRLYGQGRDGNNYSSGIITYDEYGHRVIEYVPFQNLQHSGDWNDCDRAYFIAGKIVGVGLTIAGYASGIGFVTGALIRGANAYFWKKVRKEVCH